MKKLKVVLLGSLFVLPALPGWADSEGPCGLKLQLTERINRGETRQSRAIETLTATNLVANESQADYQAGKSVTLLPGFKAEQGSVFTAQVKACSCSENLAAMESEKLTLTAYPNPFVESTIIRYRLMESSPVKLTVLNEQGQLIDVLVNGTQQEAGLHEITYSNPSLLEKVYLYSLRTKQGVVTKRLLKNH
jgi:hypothetical protein